MDVFKLSRNFFDWSFENPELITPTHSAIYFFAIEHCNRLGWKEKFGFPTSMAMEAIGIRKWETYNKAFRNLVEWGFIKEIEKSRNQYSSCIISIGNATPKNGKALDKALVKHGKKHSEKHSESTGVIDIQETNKQETRNNISIDTEQAPTYGNEELNMMQGFLRQAVGLDKFRDSKERWYVQHCYTLMKKIGKEEFQYRLKEILSDQFKAKNCNKLAYLYGELKSFIHSPVVEQKSQVKFNIIG